MVSQVKAILDDGLLPDWNRSDPERSVRPYETWSADVGHFATRFGINLGAFTLTLRKDKIFEVNGQAFGSVDLGYDMQESCSKSEEVSKDRGLALRESVVSSSGCCQAGTVEELQDRIVLSGCRCQKGFRERTV